MKIDPAAVALMEELIRESVGLLRTAYPQYKFLVAGFISDSPHEPSDSGKHEGGSGHRAFGMSIDRTASDELTFLEGLNRLAKELST